MAPETTDTLTITKTFAATPERLFAAWTEAAQLAKWTAPGNFSVEKSISDPQINGTWERILNSPQADQPPLLMNGRYLKLMPPTQLVLTWDMPGNKHAATTTINVEFTAAPSSSSPSTVMTFTQSGFPAAPKEQIPHYIAGWDAPFKKLANLVEN